LPSWLSALDIGSRVTAIANSVIVIRFMGLISFPYQVFLGLTPGSLPG
jgi:hypothetical protein